MSDWGPYDMTPSELIQAARALRAIDVEVERLELENSALRAETLELKGEISRLTMDICSLKEEIEILNRELGFLDDDEDEEKQDPRARLTVCENCGQEIL